MNPDNAYIRQHLTAANRLFYEEQGYLVAEELLPAEAITSLKKEAAAIFKGGRGQVEGLLPVAENMPDAEVLKQYVAIHFPHKLSPLIRDFLFKEAIVDILTQIISSNLKCMQSMLFVKGPGKKGQSWHQDEFYIPTRDKSLTGVWIAIDDATIDNGCLWLIPGSHRPGYIRPRVPTDNPEFNEKDSLDISGFPKEAIIPVEVKSGSVIFFNGYTLHSSLSNKTSDHFRTALVNHYMSAESMLPWDQDGKHEPTDDLRDIVLIAGTDPYAWKGITNVNKPYLRPELKAK
ncbi:phytanoyl-CoA dioxygenase family protein [Mucilaginibacter sp. dw_454]|uniref:phytanoyl-CoA dioxygenase family protein n=1 Tax=Mucilaginibacter sp. dw_454 TaxID=2720079 RepID=UPI001BD2E860|nr:phytanoyl-CoA dioxygenase family protein [Mucilaginibacter sp. dw_454]